LTAALAHADDDPSAWPRLIVLDLKLPDILGIDVLRWIRQQPRLRTLPVLILSGSDHPDDIEQARQLGASSYLVKPCNFSGRLTQANQLKLWLLDQGTLPASPGWQEMLEKPSAS
jgi:CheY-like chemotaxis protein